ncbi:zona pellucida-like domain-containing protein 1 [Acanthopagrus latus]|uniref:zona pellucida-like domain-containing protein 1 n=1 Tax=Acanthopagrus latus TaxID=8177 RepID=UPI00187BEF9C|nr:zona pellucida-like domain-containing protein 1 [Acanthopagrus latus]
MITYQSQILYKFSCLYPMQYLLNNTKLAVSGASLMIKDNNGSFISTLSMQLCRDNLYKELLIIPEEGLSPRTEIYVAVKATELSDRFNVLLDRCYASTSPYLTHSTYHDLFIGCARDAHTKVELNGASQVAHFSFEAFRFTEHRNQTVSTFYLHCITRLCEVSSCSRLLPNCSSSRRMSKREAQSVSDSTTVTSSAIHVGTLDTDAVLSTTDVPPRYPTLEQNIYKNDPPASSVFNGGATSSPSCYSIPSVAPSYGFIDSTAEEMTGSKEPRAGTRTRGCCSEDKSSVHGMPPPPTELNGALLPTSSTQCWLDKSPFGSHIYVQLN